MEQFCAWKRNISSVVSINSFALLMENTCCLPGFIIVAKIGEYADVQICGCAEVQI